MEELLLETIGLTYRYDDTFALRGLDLRVRKGARMAILGANGAGKSTLFLHLNGTLRPASGTILLDGQPVGYQRKQLIEWRRRVGIVFQNPDDQLFAPTVWQDISFGPSNHGLPSDIVCQRVEETICNLGLTAVRDQPIHTLSHGMKKRVAIAGVVAMEPRLLILDEPTAGLDHRGIVEMLALIDRLHCQGTTIVMATHDIDLAVEWADEIAILESGRRLIQGHPDEVLRNDRYITDAGLQTPLVPAISRWLVASGQLPVGASPPRSRHELIELFKSGLSAETNDVRRVG